MSNSNLLFRIHNKTILSEILNNISFEKLIRISYKNKKLQQFLNLTLETYKTLSQNKHLVSSMCLLFDVNVSLRENPSVIINKYIKIPFLGYKHIKVLNEQDVQFFCPINTNENSFLLCGNLQTNYVKINFEKNEVNVIEIKNEKGQSILNSVYPIQMIDSIYIFNSKNQIYAIDFSKDNYIGKVIYETSDNLDFLSITKMSNHNFLVANEKGDCIYFEFEPINLNAKKKREINNKAIFSFIKLTENIIITYSGNTIFTMNVEKENIINQKIEHIKEIFAFTLTKNEDFICSGSLDGTLIIWSIKNNGEFNLIKKFDNLQSKSIFEILPLKNNDICVYGQEEKLNIISMKNQNILFNLTGIESSVASLFELNDGRIFVCTYDSKITIFNRLNGNIDIILFNLFSIPKYFFQCENYALFVVKFNGDVDVLGLSNYQDINNNITFSENIIQFDIDERF